MFQVEKWYFIRIIFVFQDIEASGMVVKDIVVVIDRQEGGVKNVTDRGYNVHCLYTLDQVCFKKLNFLCV